MQPRIVRQLPPLLAALFAVALVLPYTGWSFLLTGDLRDIYLPLEDFFRAELLAGRLPMWDPAAALGFPVLASAQIGFWYPPLFLLRVLPPEPAFAIAIALHLVALAAGTFRYSAKLNISRPGSLLAALAFTGSGFIVGHLVHANILFGITWLPWALLLTERLAENLRPKTAILLGLTLALPALAGHFHVAAMIAAFCALRFLLLLRKNFRSVAWQHVFWVFALTFGPVALGVLLLTAAQLFPTLELLRESSRGAGGGFDIARANQHSFPPWQLVTFLVPAFYGFPDLSEYWGTRPQIEMTAWVGAIPLLLAILGAARARTRARASLLPRFWIATAVVGFLLALGRWSPLRLIGIEPTFGIFSAPARYLLFSQFALALLAGAGLDRLREHVSGNARAREGHEGSRGLKIAGLVGTGTALLIAAGFLFVSLRPDALRELGRATLDRVVLGKTGHVLSREAYEQKVEYLVRRLGTWGVNLRHPLVLLSASLLGTAGTILLTTAARGRSPRNPARLTAAAVALTATELVLVAWQVHPTVAWADVSRISPVVLALQKRPPGRLSVIHPQGDTGLLFANPTTKDRAEHERLLRDLAIPNILTRHGISGAEWPAALDLSVASAVVGEMRDDQGRPTNERLLDRLGIRYVAGSSMTPNLRIPSPAREILSFPSGEGATIRVWERPSARPRVELLQSLPRDIRDPLPESVGKAAIIREHPQEVEILADNRVPASGPEGPGAGGNPTPGTATLVLRDSFYPGWQAMLDGNPALIERADTLFRGVSVPQGRHTITFRYRPGPARKGLIISAAAWSAALALLIQGRPRRTR